MKMLDKIFGFFKNLYELCGNDPRFFDILKIALLAALVAASLSSCSGLYQLNKAIAYEIKYNKVQDTHSDLNLNINSQN